MSRHFAIIGKNSSIPSDEKPGAPGVPPCEYTELIQQLFKGSSVVAIIGASFGHGVTRICEGIASELSRQGKRVVLVSVSALLRSNPIALCDEAASMPWVGRNVWSWPSPVSQQVELFKPCTPAVAKNWLASLRQEFDSVLLDCLALEAAPGGAAIAAMAEAAVLAVDAARTPKHQILLDQRLLQLSGVNLAGCILINAK